MDVKNYTPEQVNQIKSYISEKSLLIADSIKWVDGNLKHEDRSKTLLSLKRAQNKLNKIASNIEAKPVIAVFGASQVGKSYLIKNLLSQKGESFKIINNQDSYDFLKDINPAGTGKESTGVVTRFSVDQDIKFVDFPIRIKLLSAKDILTIILDSYFLDLKKITSATINNRRAIESHIKKYELAKDSVKQNYLSEQDVLEVKEYFGNHLSKHTLLFEGLTETRYFERIASIIEYFDYKEWTSIFEILWNNNEDLSGLFSDLLSKLNSIHFTSQGYIKFNDVLRAGGEILDVKRLLEFYTNIEFTTLKLDSGSEIQINISYLSALLSELIFSIPKDLIDTKPFLKNSDLLDFPGARSRLGIEEDSVKSNLSDMLLRGKVSYLFNKYSDDYSINNLLFCTNDKLLEVSELSYLLYNWISTNIGSNIDDRSHSLGKSEIYPLFVIFTFFNNQLRYDITNDEGYLINENKLNDKWDTRFVRFFENEVVTKSRDWHMQWSHQSQDFTNFYLLRDYKYSTDTYDGYETENIETEIREERVPFINAMKKTFLNFPFVQKHFRKPEESWHEATDLNKDGSELIITNLEKVSTNYTKINHYVNLLNNTVEELQRNLSTYIKTDDITEHKNKNMSAMSQFQLQFNMALARDLGVFNELIHQISLQPIEVFNLLNENLYVDTSKIEEGSTSASSILVTTYPDLATASSYNEALEILRSNMMLPSTKEVEELLLSSGIAKDEIFVAKNSSTKAEYFTDLVIDFWKNRLLDAKRFNSFTDFGISRNSLEFLLQHLIVVVQKREIRKKLIKILNDVISEIDSARTNEVFLAETFSIIINDIAYNFDINYLTEEERLEMKNLNVDNRSTFFERQNPTDNKTVASLFDNTNLDVNTIALEKYNRWIEFMRLSLVVNSGFVNYDEASNNQLKSIVENYKLLTLN